MLATNLTISSHSIGMRLRGLLMAVMVVSLLLSGTIGTSSATATSIECSCVLYVRSQTGLTGGIATAAGYTESVMWSKGYRRVLPTAGAILVWDANQKGAYGAGHMAIIQSARYDSYLKKWLITVRHSNWGGCGIRNTSFSWGNLYGVNAYVRR